MKIETFDEDAFKLKEFAERLERFIEVEHDFVEDSLVLSLTSPFGSGKSTFLRMWENHLLQNSSTNRPIVISLNAWKEDYCGDPLYAVISAIVAKIGEKRAENIIRAAKGVGRFVATITGQVVENYIGIDIEDALEKAIKSGSHEVRAAPDVYSTYMHKQEAMDELKNAIQKWIGEDVEKPEVLFLVDELDRCRPDYAISYLETIKHIFDIRGAVFILAVDLQQLENSAKHAFGYKLNFGEYYRKFVHREISLPPISSSNYNKLADRYVKYYLNRTEKRYCAVSLSGWPEIIGLISALKLTPRQIQEVFRIIGHIFSTIEQSHGGEPSINLSSGSIFMTVLRMGNRKMYTRLGSQRIGIREAYRFIYSLPFAGDLSRHNSKYWFALLLSGGATEGGLEEIDELDENVASDSGVQAACAGPIDSDWGFPLRPEVVSYFVEIRDRIEHIYQWAW